MVMYSVMKMEEAILKLYPGYTEDVRIWVKANKTGIDKHTMIGYDKIVKTEHIPKISVFDYVNEMTAGEKPVAKLRGGDLIR